MFANRRPEQFASSEYTKQKNLINGSGQKFFIITILMRKIQAIYPHVQFFCLTSA